MSRKTTQSTNTANLQMRRAALGHQAIKPSATSCTADPPASARRPRCRPMWRPRWRSRRGARSNRLAEQTAIAVPSRPKGRISSPQGTTGSAPGRNSTAAPQPKPAGPPSDEHPCDGRQCRSSQRPQGIIHKASPASPKPRACRPNDGPEHRRRPINVERGIAAAPRRRVKRNETPFLDQQDGWTIDGTSFKVRIDAVAKAIDWRALAKNAGA